MNASLLLPSMIDLASSCRAGLPALDYGSSPVLAMQVGSSSITLDGSDTVVVIACGMVLILMARSSIIAALAAGTVAWLGHPFILPLVSELLQQAERNQAALAGASSSLAQGSAAEAFDHWLTLVASQLPGPVALAVALLFITTFLLVKGLQIAAR